MLKITLKKYPLDSTWSEIELMPEDQLPAPNDSWLSQKPISKAHIFDIDRPFYPLAITLLKVLRDNEVVYEFQGINPDQPNYQSIIIGSPAYFDYYIATERWYPAVVSTHALIIGGIVVLGGIAVVAGLNQYKES